jgi:hypothetical protein
LGARIEPLRAPTVIAMEAGPEVPVRALTEESPHLGADAVRSRRGPVPGPVALIHRRAPPEARHAKHAHRRVRGPGSADAPVERAIFGENSAQRYEYDSKRRAGLTTDRIALAQADYEREGRGGGPISYGYLPKPGA